MFNPIPEFVWDYLGPLVGNRMIELGRKKTLKRKCPEAVDEVDYGDEWVTYKSYFEGVHGYEHISIDIQGGYGSLAYDLTTHIHLDPADMVTNFGTTEHVSKQEPCWHNIHNFCKVGGVIVSTAPLPGDWWWHGNWYPTEKFYESFAKMNGYEITYLAVGGEHPKRSVDARMVKVDDLPFTMPSMEHIYNNKIRPRNSGRM